MSRKITYLPSRWELPSPRIRPSCTATTAALGALTRSTNRGAALAFVAPLVAAAPAAVGAGGGTEPGVDPPTGALLVGALLVGALLVPVFAAPVTAVAFAVALDGDAGVGSSEPHATCLPVTGNRASTSPVSVAITDLG